MPLSKSKETLSTNSYFSESSVLLIVLLGERRVDNYTSEVKVFIWKTLNTSPRLPHLEADGATGESEVT